MSIESTEIARETRIEVEVKGAPDYQAPTAATPIRPEQVTIRFWDRPGRKREIACWVSGPRVKKDGTPGKTIGQHSTFFNPPEWLPDVVRQYVGDL